jgi:hypothetical protein
MFRKGVQNLEDKHHSPHQVMTKPGSVSLIQVFLPPTRVFVMLYVPNCSVKGNSSSDFRRRKPRIRSNFEGLKAGNSVKKCRYRIREVPTYPVLRPPCL